MVQSSVDHPEYFICAQDYLQWTEIAIIFPSSPANFYSTRRRDKNSNHSNSTAERILIYLDVGVFIIWAIRNTSHKILMSHWQLKPKEEIKLPLLLQPQFPSQRSLPGLLTKYRQYRLSEHSLVTNLFLGYGTFFSHKYR